MIIFNVHPPLSFISPLFVYPSIHQPIIHLYPFICPFIRLFIRPFIIYASIHLSFICLSTRIDLESPDFIDHLQPFLHEKTEHFLHELISFAKSPLDITAYDNKVSYGLSQKTTTQREGKKEQPIAEVSSLPGTSI